LRRRSQPATTATIAACPLPLESVPDDEFLSVVVNPNDGADAASLSVFAATNNDGDAIIELFITCQIARQVVSIGVNIQGIEV
jgi:hypothetical protein